MSVFDNPQVQEMVNEHIRAIEKDVQNADEDCKQLMLLKCFTIASANAFGQDSDRLWDQMFKAKNNTALAVLVGLMPWFHDHLKLLFRMQDDSEASVPEEVSPQYFVSVNILGKDVHIPVQAQQELGEIATRKLLGLD